MTRSVFSLLGILSVLAAGGLHHLLAQFRERPVHHEALRGLVVDHHHAQGVVAPRDGSKAQRLMFHVMAMEMLPSLKRPVPGARSRHGKRLPE